MLGYPKKPAGGIRKASKKHDREDKANEPDDYMEASRYWRELSIKYDRTSKYYWEVSNYYMKIAIAIPIVSIVLIVLMLLAWLVISIV